MTTKTPYDAEWQKLQNCDGMPAGYVETRAKREGYLRALADAQPRIDALAAALALLVEYFEQAEGWKYTMNWEHLELSQTRKRYLKQVSAAIKAALKPAGEE